MADLRPRLKNTVNPLTWNVPIANPDGTPTNEFQRKWGQQAAMNAAIPDLTTVAGVSSRLDLLGSSPGMLLERGATYWGGLASPADATKFLNGAAFPAYAAVKDSDLAVTDITTNNVTNLKHGFAPKSPADVTKFLNGGASPAYAAVKDSDLSLSDITTNDVSVTAHGFAPKAPNDATKFLNGLGLWTVPAGGGGSAPSSALDDGTNFYLALQDAAGQLVLDVFGDPIFMLEVLPPTALPVATAAAFGAMKPDGVSITIAGGVITAVPVTHAFQVILSSDFAFSEGTSTTVVFNSASIDTDAAYSVGTGIYTPKKAGKWFFQGAFKVDATAGAINFAEILLNKNGSFVNLGLLGAYTAGASQTPGGVSGAILQMNGTTDNVNMNVYVSTTGAAGGKVLTGLGAGFFGFWIGP